MSAGGFGTPEEQERVLDECTATVREQGFHLRRALDKESTRDALKAASAMVGELRTSQLGPKNYYDLYTLVVTELQQLGKFFADTDRHGRKMIELYESVQHAGAILPRLYLLVTVSAAYIESREAPAHEILKDVGELCKGCQDPLRGLFLRYYLGQVMKDKLPDEGSPYECDGGSVADAFEFLVNNMEECNRLWVRVPTNPGMRDRTKAQKERSDLRVLVGANLVRISQLAGMSAEFYEKTALPGLLKVVFGLKESSSQQSLLENIISIFPDEYHMRTAGTFLKFCGDAHHNVDLKSVVVLLLTRLARHLKDSKGAKEEFSQQDTFGSLRGHLLSLMSNKMTNAAKETSGTSPSRELGACLEMKAAFMNFTLTLYPDEVLYVDKIFGSTINLIKKYIELTGNPKIPGDGTDKIVDILSCPLKYFGLGILDMEDYTTLTEFLDFETRKKVAVSLARGISDGNHALPDIDAIKSLFRFIGPLVKDEADSPTKQRGGDRFISEQQSVAKLVHQVQGENTDDEFNMILTMRGFFGRGGPERMAVTLPSVFFAAHGLIPRIRQTDAFLAQNPDMPKPAVSIKKVYQFLHKTLTELQKVSAESATKLWFLAAASADKEDQVCGNPGSYEAICYEFLTQGMIAYEEDVLETTKQYSCLSNLVGTMCSLTCLEDENFDMISQKLVQHAARLLRKPMQCRAIALCSNMFWCPVRRDGKRVIECLKKCVKTADALVASDTTQVGLWVEMLEKYLGYYEVGVEDVQASFVVDLLAVCQEHISFAEKEPASVDQAAKAKKHLEDIFDHIKIKKSSSDHEVAARYNALEV